MIEGQDAFELLRKFQVINCKNKGDHIMKEEGPNSLIRFAFCAFNPSLREVQMKLAPWTCQPHVHLTATWRLGLQAPFIAPINLQRDIREKTNEITAEHCDLPALLKNVECSCPRRQSSSFEIGQATTNSKTINTLTNLKMMKTHFTSMLPNNNNFDHFNNIVSQGRS